MSGAEVPVTQADRKAAAALVRALSIGAQMVVGHQHNTLGQSFARHRAASEAPHVARIAALEAEIARLREGLGFYADVAKYPAPLTGGMGALWSDCGQVARAALAVPQRTEAQP